MEAQSLVQELFHLNLNFLTKSVSSLLVASFTEDPSLMGSLKHCSELVLLLTTLEKIAVLFITSILKYWHTRKLCTLGLVEVASTGCVLCLVKVIKVCQ